MFHGLRKKAGQVVGLAGIGRDDSPPQYRAVAPGLIVDDNTAWAWFEIPTTNSDLQSDDARDREQDQVESALRVLQGRECHIRVLWGRIDGAAYLDGLNLDGLGLSALDVEAVSPNSAATGTAAPDSAPTTETSALTDLPRYGDRARYAPSLASTTAMREAASATVTDNEQQPQASAAEPLPQAREWAEQRADNIDALSLPAKRILLGVKLADRETRGRSLAWLGLPEKRIPDAELARWSSAAVQIGRSLAATVWRVRLAATELLLWSIVRELHRDKALPIEDVVQGAQLARLVGGTVLPYSDHLRALDASGAVAAHIAVITLSDWPEETTTPGQEWLGMLNQLETAPLDVPGAVAEPVQVLAEVSTRFRVPLPSESRKIVDAVHDKAGEQIRSAGQNSAGAPDDEVLLAREETAALRLALRRGHTSLVEDHPRIIVSTTTREELDAKVIAVTHAYDRMGITAHVAVDEQRELWLETLPNDHVRVPDLGHVRDTTAFAQSWFWGGSRVGDVDPTVPVIGYTTGSTQSLVRFLATASTSASDAPVTVLLGRTRRGKTTAMTLMLLDVALNPGHCAEGGAWQVLIDPKGDAGGVVDVARHYGVPADRLVVGPEHSGALDGFFTSDPEQAVTQVVAQLSLLLPASMAATSQGVLQRVTDRIAQQPDPRSWRVIETLAAAEDVAAREVGQTLAANTRTGFGRLIAGRTATGGASLPSRPGITVVQLPGLTLPEVDTREDQWNPTQRASVAALRGVLGWCTTMAGAMELRGKAKVIAVPEVHVLTANADGRTFLTQSARMGAALGASFIFDTQDVSGIAAMTGLAEGISAVFGFAQRTDVEQDALAAMVGLEVGQNMRDVIDALDRPTASDLAHNPSGQREVRRGHCLFRDRYGDVASVQWVVPSPQVQAMLDTSAKATAERADLDAAAHRAQRMRDTERTDAERTDAEQTGAAEVPATSPEPAETGTATRPAPRRAAAKRTAASTTSRATVTKAVDKAPAKTAARRARKAAPAPIDLTATASEADARTGAGDRA